MTEKMLKWLFLLQCQLLLLFVFSAEGVEGGADAICHWAISQKAMSNPVLFLDQWNKPIFTLLSFPFAQFGLIGMRVFSAVVGICTGYLLYLTVKDSFGKLSWLPSILLMLLPQYLVLLTSSMTEPLFALFLAMFLFLVAKKMEGWAALVAGLSPFVRQEGFALIIIAALILMLSGKPKKLPWLMVGTLVFALVGFVVFGEPDWILTSFPYNSGSSQIYGNGELLHYAKYYRELFGKPISILFLFGLVVQVVVVSRKAVGRIRLTPIEMSMLSALLFALMFFGAHTMVWWMGLTGSAGLIRVMACVAPSIAMIASYGIVKLSAKKWLKFDLIRMALLITAITLSISEAVSITRLPSKPEPTLEVMNRVSEWLRLQRVKEKIYYSDPVFFYCASENLNVENLTDNDGLYLSEVSDMNVGEVVVWDAHFSANENNLPLDSLLRHRYMQKVASFHPEYSFTVLGGLTYAVHVFRKTELPVQKNVVDSVFVFENFGSYNDEFYTSPDGRFGTDCAVSDSSHEFVTVRSQLNSEVAKNVLGFELEAWVKLNEPLEGKNFYLVSNVDGVHYLSSGAESIKNYSRGHWNRISQTFELPPDLPQTFELRGFIWNPDSLEIFVDDLKLTATYLKQHP